MGFPLCEEVARELDREDSFNELQLEGTVFNLKIVSDVMVHDQIGSKLYSSNYKINTKT